MANERNMLAEKMDMIGRIFEIDGMSELLRKFDPEEDEEGNKKPIGIVKFNAVVIQVSALLLRNNKPLADQIIAMGAGMTDEEVQAMDDAAYAGKLRDVIITDVMGFFASSPRTGGRK